MLELTSNLWDTVEVTDANGWYDLIFPETEGMAKGEPYYLSVVWSSTRMIKMRVKLK